MTDKRIPWNKGKNHTEETKQKISEARTGKSHSEETKEKMSETAKKRVKKPCPVCGKLVDHVNMKRWHGENCKNWSKRE